jgi:hypothetical protein
VIRVEHSRPKPTTWRTRLLWVISILIVLLSLGTGGFAAWALIIPAPMAEAISALESTPEVRVQSSPWYSFHPQAAEPDTGLIFYPGGRVDPRAYAPAAQTIAREGVLVVIVPMPLNLAVMAPGRAREVMEAYPHIQTWHMGGHSLGGAMAANFVHRNPDCCAGLILWAAYPAEDADLSAHTSLRALSVYGTLDGLATPEQILNSRARLPDRTRLLPIAGGNHAQFGWYGPQRGDNPATLSRIEQQRQAIDATLDLLLGGNGRSP